VAGKRKVKAESIIRFLYWLFVLSGGMWIIDDNWGDCCNWREKRESIGGEEEDYKREMMMMMMMAAAFMDWSKNKKESILVFTWWWPHLLCSSSSLLEAKVNAIPTTGISAALQMP
jgi:hypothetical protein